MSSEPGYSGEVITEDTLNILVATDIHLGYHYNKKRGWFSADTPPEIHLSLLFEFKEPYIYSIILKVINSHKVKNRMIASLLLKKSLNTAKKMK